MNAPIALSTPRHRAGLAALLALAAVALGACGNHDDARRPAGPAAPAGTGDANVDPTPTPVPAGHAPPAASVGPAPVAAPANVPPPPSAPVAIAPPPRPVPPTLADNGTGASAEADAPTAAGPQDRFFTGRTWEVVRSQQISPGSTYRFEADGRMVIANPGSKPGHYRWEPLKTGEGAGAGAQSLRLIELEGSYPATLVPHGHDQDTLTLTVHGPGQPVVATLRAQRPAAAVGAAPGKRP